MPRKLHEGKPDPANQDPVTPLLERGLEAPAPVRRDVVVLIDAIARDPDRLDEVAAQLRARYGVSVEVLSAEPTRDLNALSAWALEHDATLEDLSLARPTLEDVYLDLVGHGRGTQAGGPDD